MPVGDVERWEQYGPGGFHPILLGDYLADGRFLVEEKLGNGGFGTVWLCHDLLKNKWKAVKVLAAHASGEDCCSDLFVLDHFMDLTPEERASSHLCLPEEYFYEDGPNGRHLCLVLPLLGTSLSQLWHRYGDQPTILKHVCGQLVEAMNTLHSRKICHGDFRPDNIMFRLVGIEELLRDDLMAMVPQSREIQALGPDPTEEDPEPQLSPHMPTCLYTATSVEVTPEYTTRGIMVTDFGEAYHADYPRPDVGIPWPYAAPEVVFPVEETKVQLGYATDIWALGATICEIRQGVVPFEGDSVETLINDFEEMIGPLPEPYRSTACNDPRINTSAHDSASDALPVSLFVDQLEEFAEIRIEKCGYADGLKQIVFEPREFAVPMEDGEDLSDKPNQRYAAKGYKYVSYQTPADEAYMVLDLLRGIFQYAQVDRLTIPQIVAHPWFGDFFNQETSDIKVEAENDDAEKLVDDQYDAEEVVETDESFDHGLVAERDHQPSSVDSKEDSEMYYDATSLVSDNNQAVGAATMDMDESSKVSQKEENMEFDLDKEMRDPFGPIYQECKRLWRLEHPNHWVPRSNRAQAVQEPHYVHLGAESHTAMFRCQVM